MKYYCKYCGVSYSSVQSLTNCHCNKSPSGYHQLYEGSEKSRYVCKYCGVSYSSIQSLTNCHCNKSETGYHEPAL